LSNWCKDVEEFIEGIQKEWDIDIELIKELEREWNATFIEVKMMTNHNITRIDRVINGMQKEVH